MEPFFEMGMDWAGIHLPNTGLPSYTSSFTVPPNYRPGTELTMHILWHAALAQTNCTVRFRKNALTISRAGRRFLTGGTNGMTVVGGETLTVPSTTYESVETLVTIQSGEAGTVHHLRYTMINNKRRILVN